MSDDIDTATIVAQHRENMARLEQAQAHAAQVDHSTLNTTEVRVIGHLMRTSSPLDGPYQGIGWRSLHELLSDDESIDTRKLFGDALTRGHIKLLAEEEEEAHMEYQRFLFSNY
jgi:hypothetical protein